MKNIIKNLANRWGYEIKKIRPGNIDFESLLKNKIPKNPIIFDVGASKGESVDEFLNNFVNPTIHSFEPIKADYDLMLQKFRNKKNVILNNLAVGEKNYVRQFNVTANSQNSSFINITPGTNWVKKRSEEQNITEASFVDSVIEAQVISLDEYCETKNIAQIDLLKIDTQGYEDKVLEGCMTLLDRNKIKAIKTEIMFDDVYDKYFSFSDLEEFIDPKKYRMVGLELTNNNLFSGLNWFANVYYLNKNYYKI